MTKEEVTAPVLEYATPRTRRQTLTARQVEVAIGIVFLAANPILLIVLLWFR